MAKTKTGSVLDGIQGRVGNVVFRRWGEGYVVSTLEAALWAFAGTTTFRDGCLAVVNLGDDADTML